MIPNPLRLGVFRCSESPGGGNTVSQRFLSKNRFWKKIRLKYQLKICAHGKPSMFGNFLHFGQITKIVESKIFLWAILIAHLSASTTPRTLKLFLDCLVYLDMKIYLASPSLLNSTKKWFNPLALLRLTGIRKKYLSKFCGLTIL